MARSSIGTANGFPEKAQSGLPNTGLTIAPVTGALAAWRFSFTPRFDGHLTPSWLRFGDKKNIETQVMNAPTRSSTAKRLQRIALAAVALVLSACASLPSERAAGIDTALVLERVKDAPHVLIEQRLDRERLIETREMALPSYRVAEGAASADITAAQGTLVANQAARSLCEALANYFVIVDAASADAATPRLVVTAIRPTGAATSGLSSLVDVLVPIPIVPTRLPAGLGGLAVDAELTAADGAQIGFMRWARGANSITDNAKISIIGDAWQLADEFGEEFAKAIVVDSVAAGTKPARLVREQIKANQARCAATFGKINLATSGVGRLLPLSPEALDSGPPTAAETPASIPPPPADPPPGSR